MHLLQSPPWGALKSHFGWSARLVLLPGCPQPAQVLYRQLPLGLRLAYIPKGPALADPQTLIAPATLAALKQLAAPPTTLFLKIEPDLLDNPALVRSLLAAGFTPGRPVQPPNTIILDISRPEAEILAAMKSKTRYNIRLAGRKGITIRPGAAADLPIFYELSQVTTERNDFANRPLPYFQALLAEFPPQNRALLLAEYQGQPLAGLLVFAWQERAYYLYGASNNRHRNRMPTYLLQWEAIRWARAAGCHTYDLVGIPDAPLETLEAEFTTRQDGLWGVYRFKRGFGGRIVRSLGAFDYVPPLAFPKRLLYRLLTVWLKRRDAMN